MQQDLLEPGFADSWQVNGVGSSKQGKILQQLAASGCLGPEDCSRPVRGMSQFRSMPLNRIVKHCSPLQILHCLSLGGQARHMLFSPCSRERALSGIAGSRWSALQELASRNGDKQNVQTSSDP